MLGDDFFGATSAESASTALAQLQAMREDPSRVPESPEAQAMLAKVCRAPRIDYRRRSQRRRLTRYRKASCAYSPVSTASPFTLSVTPTTPS